jgi:hypothetical protein
MVVEACEKHNQLDAYRECFAQLLQIRGLMKRANSGWSQFQHHCQENMDKAWKGYMHSTCTCLDAASTLRIGASWAGPPRPADDAEVANDVANLADVAEE